jgi:hypothetical protein
MKDIKEKLVDLDLDVINTMKGLPEGEDDSYFYIRTHIEKEEGIFGCSANGCLDLMSFGLSSVMEENEDFKGVVYCAIADYLSSNGQEEVNSFIKHLKDFIEKNQ